MSNCIGEFEEEAKAKLDLGVYNYIEGGAGDESGMIRNRSDLEAIQFVSRVLRGVDKRDVNLSIDLLRKKSKSPILIAPMGYQSMVHPNGEIEMAQAAKLTETIMVVPTLATQGIGDIAHRSSADLWFQLYFMKDQGLTQRLVEQAVKVGCKALVVTVDVPCRGARYRDRNSGFQISKEYLPKNFLPTSLLSDGIKTDYRQDIASLVKGSLSWADVEWLRHVSNIPIVLKGILNPEDAKIAVENEIPAIVVSNHGGRQFDALVSPVAAIPRIRDAVKTDLEILVDSGLRSGSDILRVLCLGANGVMIGRPALWALASGGAEGVVKLLNELEEEIKIGMTILGAKMISDLNRGMIF